MQTNRIHRIIGGQERDWVGIGQANPYIGHWDKAEIIKQGYEFAYPTFSLNMRGRR